MVKTSYALLFTRNGIRTFTRECYLWKELIAPYKDNGGAIKCPLLQIIHSLSILWS